VKVEVWLKLNHSNNTNFISFCMPSDVKALFL